MIKLQKENIDSTNEQADETKAVESLAQYENDAFADAVDAKKQDQISNDFQDNQIESIPNNNPSDEKVKRKKIILIFLISLFTGILLITCFFVFLNRTPVVAPVVTPVLSPTIIPSPVASESAKLKLSDLSIQIQNGSGVSGEANRVKEILKKEGFEKFETGNADTYDYTDTQVSMKEKTPAQVYETIEKALNSQFTLVKAKSLTEASKYEVIVIIGKKK